MHVIFERVLPYYYLILDEAYLIGRISPHFQGSATRILRNTFKNMLKLVFTLSAGVRLIKFIAKVHVSISRTAKLEHLRSIEFVSTYLLSSHFLIAGSPEEKLAVLGVILLLHDLQTVTFCVYKKYYAAMAFRFVAVSHCIDESPCSVSRERKKHLSRAYFSKTYRTSKNAKQLTYFAAI